MVVITSKRFNNKNSLIRASNLSIDNSIKEVLKRALKDFFGKKHNRQKVFLASK